MRLVLFQEIGGLAERVVPRLERARRMSRQSPQRQLPDRIDIIRPEQEVLVINIEGRARRGPAEGEARNQVVARVLILEAVMAMMPVIRSPIGATTFRVRRDPLCRLPI